MKSLLVSLLVIFTIGCSNPTTPLELSEWEVEIESRLDKNSDGYYLLPINQGTFQTLHRLSGQLTENGETPSHREKVGWESSHIWVLSDTLGYIVRRTINDEGKWAVLDTSYVIGFGEYEVPTINSVSITKDSGEFNTMIAPIRPMQGDTMTIRSFIYKNGKEFDNIIKIILE